MSSRPSVNIHQPIPQPPITLILGSSNNDDSNINTRDAGFVFPWPHLDVGNIDVVLISNYKTIQALPFLTKDSRFRGKIIATIPTKEFGELIMEELSEQFTDTSLKIWQRPWDPSSSKQFTFYDIHAIKDCVSRIHAVRYDERVENRGITFVAHSSGYCLGGCNFMIETASYKVAYWSHSSVLAPRHPSLLNIAALLEADAWIVANLGSQPCPFKDIGAAMSRIVVDSISNSKNVVILTPPMGPLFDIISFLAAKFADLTAAHTRLVETSRSLEYYIHVVSTVSKRSLALTHILGEYSNPQLQTNLYRTPDKGDSNWRLIAPLCYWQLCENGRVLYDTDVQGLLKHHPPYLVMTGHESVRAGTARDLFWLWKDSENTVIIDPSPEPTMLPDTCSCQVIHLPLDVRLSLDDFNTILHRASIPTIILPNHVESEITYNSGVILTYDNSSTAITIPLLNDLVNVTISKELSHSIRPNAFINGHFVAPFHATLDLRSNTLLMPSSTSPTMLPPILDPMQRIAGLLRLVPPITSTTTTKDGSREWFFVGGFVKWDAREKKLEVQVDDKLERVRQKVRDFLVGSDGRNGLNT